MGRRRTIGEARSAGAGRRCKHPSKQREYQPGTETFRIRCRRCGQELLPVAPPLARARDKRWVPHA